MYGQLGGATPFQITFGGMTWTGGTAAGVSTIQAIDASFNGDDFLTYAQGVFARVMEARAAGKLDDVRAVLSQPMYDVLRGTKGKPPKIASIQHATIFDAHRDASWDSVTVRIAAKTTARKHNDFVEDWTFQRPAVTGQQQLPTECPSCGAPLALDAGGACPYCRVNVGGARGGWKLVRAVPPPTAPKVSSGAGAWVLGFVIFIILMTVALPIAIFAIVMHSTSSITSNAFGTSSGGVDNVSAKSGERITPTTARPKATTPATTPVPTADPTPTITGTANLSGAVSGEMDGKIAFAGGATGACAARVPKVSGFVYTATGTIGTEDLTVTINANLPTTARGPGDFNLATTPMTMTAAFAGVLNDGSGKVEEQHFVVDPATTATLSIDANLNGSMTITGLHPTVPYPAGDPWANPLSIVINFTCT